MLIIQINQTYISSVYTYDIVLLVFFKFRFVCMILKLINGQKSIMEKIMINKYKVNSDVFSNIENIK